MSISVTKIVKLKKTLPTSVEYNASTDSTTTIGGVLSDSIYSWFATGPELTVVNNKSGIKVGQWTFGSVLKDAQRQVTCVDSLQKVNGRLQLLVVGINCDLNSGMICVFNFCSSKVLRAIHLRNQISSLHVIDTGDNVFALPGPLRNFDGIVAVGMEGGDVCLIDLYRPASDEGRTSISSDEIRDELNPCELMTITLSDLSNIEAHKQSAVYNKQHLSVHLNAPLDQSTPYFTLKGPKGEAHIHVNKKEVAISALYYCSQLGSLLVGFNFGAWQLFNLMDFQLSYTSPLYNDHIPISHFAIQEPADDPKECCYVWAIYSNSVKHTNHSCLPFAVMYLLLFKSKEYHEGYGVIYQDFKSGSISYQMELGVPDHNLNARVKPTKGHCLNVQSIHKGPVSREGVQFAMNQDHLSICEIVWNIQFNSKKTETYLCVFDIDQWYKAQMPSDSSYDRSSAYLVQIHLTDLITSSTNKESPLIDVYMEEKMLCQFKGPQRLEEHFYPNTLSFDITCLRDDAVILLRNSGVQKDLLAQIESSGPMCLVEPSDIYEGIVAHGLLPLFVDIPHGPTSTNQQRQIVLATALENHLVGWLCKCACEWANASFSATGCTLHLLLVWAFERSTVLKRNCDNYCEPLFNHTGHRLDNNTKNSLRCCVRQLNSICSLYSMIIRKLNVFVSNLELAKHQYEALQMVCLYYEVIQWMMNVGLLPESPLTSYPHSNEMNRVNAPYPIEKLIEYYDQRREMIKVLNQEKLRSTKSILFIDNLIDKECGNNKLHQQWSIDGGNGLYPPPSIQALLRTYLIDKVDLCYQHSVVIYLFLDLAMILDQERYKPVITYLIKFPAVFKVSPSVIKITQAFWQLDHGDYNTAIKLLLDPLVLSMDLKPWHHRVVLRSLFLQKQYNSALLYLHMRQPDLSESEDNSLIISIYVANRKMDEAFHFQQKNCDSEQMFNHLLDECANTKQIKSLIYHKFSKREELCFLKYLQNHKETWAGDIEVYYHLLKSNYIEAFVSHTRLEGTQMNSHGLFGKQNASVRDKLFGGLKTLMPNIQQELIYSCQKQYKVQEDLQPMSVFHENQYKSLVEAALLKSKQTFTDTTETFKTENTPFLRIPRPYEKHNEVNSNVVRLTYARELFTNNEECGEPSPKRQRLSPKRTDLVSNDYISSAALSTPIVKRKCSTSPNVMKRSTIPTPQSILKVKKTTINDNTPQRYTEKSSSSYLEKISTPRQSALGLSPRKPLERSTVRFEGIQNSSSSLNTSEERSPTQNVISIQDPICSPILSEANRSYSVIQEHKSATESPYFSPQGRRSYKRSLNQSTPVRSSPRLTAKKDSEQSTDGSLSSVVINKSDTPSIISISDDSHQKKIETPPTLPKSKGHKSLCRQVLETNTFTSALSTPQKYSSPRASSPSISNTNKSTEHVIERNYSSTTTSKETIETSYSKTYSTESSINSSYEFTNLSPATPFFPKQFVSDTEKVKSPSVEVSASNVSSVSEKTTHSQRFSSESNSSYDFEPIETTQYEYVNLKRGAAREVPMDITSSTPEDNITLALPKQAKEITSKEADSKSEGDRKEIINYSKRVIVELPSSGTTLTTGDASIAEKISGVLPVKSPFQAKETSSEEDDNSSGSSYSESEVEDKALPTRQEPNLQDKEATSEDDDSSDSSESQVDQNNPDPRPNETFTKTISDGVINIEKIYTKPAEEVIEIGSSSDEETGDSEAGSTEESSDDTNIPAIPKSVQSRNVFETLTTSVLQSQQDSSSYSSDEFKLEYTQMEEGEFGLFEGNIGLVTEEVSLVEEIEPLTTRNDRISLPLPCNVKPQSVEEVVSNTIKETINENEQIEGVGLFEDVLEPCDSEISMSYNRTLLTPIVEENNSDNEEIQATPNANTLNLFEGTIGFYGGKDVDETVIIHAPTLTNRISLPLPREENKSPQQPKEIVQSEKVSETPSKEIDNKPSTSKTKTNKTLEDTNTTEIPTRMLRKRAQSSEPKTTPTTRVLRNRSHSTDEVAKETRKSTLKDQSSVAKAPANKSSNESNTEQPRRNLRNRAISTEQENTSTRVLRKRSYSSDDAPKVIKKSSRLAKPGKAISEEEPKLKEVPKRATRSKK